MGRGLRVAGPASTWTRADWRRRGRSLLALALLTGVVTGGVIAAVAGARRTATSLERLAAESGTADALVDVREGGLPAVRRIERLPSVQSVAPVTLVFALVDRADFDIGLFIPRGRSGDPDLEQDRLLRGHLPVQADEVALNEPMAKLSGLDVGDRFDIATLTAEQVADERYDPPEGPVLHVRVTGVTRGPADLSTRREGNIVGTHGLYEQVRGKVDEFALYVAVRLRPEASVADLRADLATIRRDDASFDVLSTADRTLPVRRTISTLAVGLAVFAAVSGVAAAAAVVQATARHVAGGLPDDAVLGALGLDRRQRLRALAATVLPAALLAPLIAVVVAVAASPLTPIGLARRAEPSPGLRVDVPVLLLGALGTGVLVLVSGTVAAAWATRTRRDPAPGRPSAVAALASRVGAPPSVVHGLSLAFDRRPTGRPVRSTIVALAVVVVIAAGCATFVASDVALGGASDRWGSPWDLSLDFTSEEVGAAAAQIADDERFEAVARWDAGGAMVGGEPTRAVGVAQLRGSLGFTLVEGRQPGPGEVVVGPATASRVGVELGDRLRVAPLDAPDRGAALRIVGIGLFPEIDDGDFIDGIGMTSEDFARRATVVDLFEASQVVVKVAPGTNVDRATAAMRSRFDQSAADTAPVRPGVVGNLLGVVSIPRVLLAFAAVLGLAALAYAVRSTVERHRTDFATLRAIGMTRPQRWACSLAQAAAVAVAALAVGIPLGVVAGRATWSTVARSIDVAPEPVSPSLVLLGLVLGGLVLAGVASLAARPARAPAEADAAALERRTQGGAR